MTTTHHPSDVNADDLSTIDGEAPAYGTFFVGGSEFGLPTACMREVVAYPSAVTALPRSANGVVGMFTLRDEILPIVDLASILGLDAKVPLEDQRVAVIEDSGTFFGVIVDRTGEVLRPHPDEYQDIDGGDEGVSGVTEGVIRPECTERLVLALSSNALRSIVSPPRPDKANDSERFSIDRRSFSKAIVVRLGTIEMGFQIDSVLEIQSHLEIKRSPEFFRHCTGQVQLRGRTFPVLDLRQALGADSPSDDPRFVFVDHNGSSIALVVDALVETLEYPDDALLEIPRLLAQGTSKVCRHVIDMGPERQIMVVSVPDLFTEYGVGSLSMFINGDSASDEQEAIVDDHEVGFFVFAVGSAVLCVPLEDVLEVQDVSDSIFSKGEEPSEVAGLMNLRGRVVPLIETSHRLGIVREEQHSCSLALIMRDGDDTFGLMVDDIVNIKRAQASTVVDCGNLLVNKNREDSLTPFVATTLMINDRSGGGESLVVLDPRAIVGSVERQTEQLEVADQ